MGTVHSLHTCPRPPSSGVATWGLQAVLFSFV